MKRFVEKRFTQDSCSEHDGVTKGSYFEYGRVTPGSCSEYGMVKQDSCSEPCVTLPYSEHGPL